MRRNIYETTDRTSITLPIVISDVRKIMKRTYDYTPTNIELYHLKRYAQTALNGWQGITVPPEDYLSWEKSDPTEDTIDLFFMGLYGYDLKMEMKEGLTSIQGIKELLRRKQEQAHMPIDFSTDLESRSTS